MAWPLYHDNHLLAIQCTAGAAIIFSGVCLWLDTTKIKLVITTTSIELTHAFSKREFLLNEIDGYREVKGGYCLLKENGRQEMRIPSGLENLDEVKDWIKSKYKDADTLLLGKQKQELLANEKFGATEEEREHTLAKAKLYTRITNVLAVLIGLWTVILGKPYTLSWLCLMLMLPVILYQLWYFKGLVTLNDARKSAYPSLQVAVIFTCILMMAKGVSSYKLYMFDKLIEYVLGGTVLLFVMVYFIAYTGRQNGVNKKNVLVALFFLFAMYSYGCVVFFNCHYDQSKPRVLRLQVTDKRVYKGKSTSYYITTGPWGKFTESEEISISSEEYNKIQINDTVTIYLYNGRLAIPWYYLEK